LAASAELGLRISGAAPLPTVSGGLRPSHPLLRLLEPQKCRSMGAPGTSFVEVCTNRLGLRDRDHPAGEKPRVLGLGDSLTLGWGVEQGDTFLAHLERALRLGLPSLRPGVFNAALGHTSQAHQQALLRHVWDRVRPNLVVLAFAEQDDIDENIVWNPMRGVFPERGSMSAAERDAYEQDLDTTSWDGFAFRHSALARFLKGRYVRASLAAETRAIEARLASHGLQGAPQERIAATVAARRFRQAFSGLDDADWPITEQLLERIQRNVAANGAKLVLLRIPSRVSIDDGAWAAARQRFCGSDPSSVDKHCGTLARDHTARRLRAHAASHGLLYVDPGPELAAALLRGEAVYLPDDTHLARLGHARVGEHLARALLPVLGAKLEPAAVQKPRPGKRRRVGAYFYPWYRSRDFSAFSDYTPRGGGYLSDDPERIARQLESAERAELDFLLIELVPDHNADSHFNNRAVDALVSALAERRRRGDARLQFAVMSDISMVELGAGSKDRWLELTHAHLEQIWKRFVEKQRDAYMEVDGKPLVAVFSPPVAVDDPRFTVIRPYWVSHEQWQNWSRKDEVLPFWDTYPQTVTDSRFLSVVPGYNDWRLERRPQVAPYLPRLRGRTFIEQWQRAFELDPEIVLVYSYNEYYEQTQIEPTLEQGDRYLLLNQLLARRFKDRRPLADRELRSLADVVEPPVQPDEEKATWLPIDDRRVVTRGLRRLGAGRAEFQQEAELELDVEGDQSVVIGLTHEPTFEPCSRLAVTVAGEGPSQTSYFLTELAQLSVLRDWSIPGGVGRVKLSLRRAPPSGACHDGGTRPIVFTGVTRYRVASAQRKNFRVFYKTVRLDGFWDIEEHPSGHRYSWSRDRSSITVSQLPPGVRYRMTLTFLETASVTHVVLGPDAEHMRDVAITPALTATCPEPLTVSAEGTLKLDMRTATWLPSQRSPSKDRRALGVALRLITLDRVDGASTPQQKP
jgi:hypothetical protein